LLHVPDKHVATPLTEVIKSNLSPLTFSPARHFTLMMLDVCLLLHECLLDDCYSVVVVLTEVMLHARLLVAVLAIQWF
jgi:hypothetical protein